MRILALTAAALALSTQEVPEVDTLVEEPQQEDNQDAPQELVEDADENEEELPQEAEDVEEEAPEEDT